MSKLEPKKIVSTLSAEQIQEASSKYLRQVAKNRNGRSGLEMEMDDDGHTTDFAPTRRPAGHDFKYFGYYSLRQHFVVVIGRADSQTNLGTYDTEEEAGWVCARANAYLERRSPTALPEMVVEMNGAMHPAEFAPIQHPAGHQYSFCGYN